MGLIKSTNAPVLTQFSLRDVEAHARAIVAAARAESEKILTIAAEEAAKARQEAYDAGFLAGKQDGLKKGLEEGRAGGKQAALGEHKANLEKLTQTLINAVSVFENSRSELESIGATESLALAVAIARKATKLYGIQMPEVISENMKEAMRLVVQRTDVRLAVHPSQKTLLNELLPTLKQKWPNVTHIELVADETLDPGGCRIFTAGGEIDAALDTQISRIASDLLPASAEGA